MLPPDEGSGKRPGVRRDCAPAGYSSTKVVSIWARCSLPE